jgi:hypothetical protein
MVSHPLRVAVDSRLKPHGDDSVVAASQEKNARTKAADISQRCGQRRLLAGGGVG